MAKAQQSTSLASIDDFKRYFEKNLAPTVRQTRLEVGRFLVEAKNVLNQQLCCILKVWIKEKYGLPLTWLKVSERMATGEISKELADFVSSSVLQHISVDNLPDLDRRYTIFSPDVGTPVTKRFRDFTRKEIRFNVGQHGVKSLESRTSSSRPLDHARASGFRISGSSLIVIVNSLRKEIEVPITDELIDALGIVAEAS